MIILLLLGRSRELLQSIHSHRFLLLPGVVGAGVLGWFPETVTRDGEHQGMTLRPLDPELSEDQPMQEFHEFVHGLTHEFLGTEDEEVRR